ncbi:unnamed protein product [Rhizoctonia solani]|uniref:Uncharacterized protein n=1 Tax=Rhizoctonia solani TaxID=456999 RepID=A0A8H3E6U4_9AGAM|nr:unnamed protein product [Rhizoctonia solani]
MYETQSNTHDTPWPFQDLDYTVPPSTDPSTRSSLGLGGDPGAASRAPDAHAVSKTEAAFYYAGLHSRPRLLYRTGKEKWLRTGPMGDSRLRDLREVFNHPLTKVWNDNLGWRVVKIMDERTIPFTTIDVVRFTTLVYDQPRVIDEEASESEDDADEDDADKVDADKDDADKDDADEEDDGGESIKARLSKKPELGPVTIWIGVYPGSTSATAAHNAAQDVLALLKDYEITDVDVDFRESYYTREAGPRLLDPPEFWDPLFKVASPITHALGLGIYTKARLDAQGTMALYLAEGGDSDKLLGLSCRHVLIGPKEANIDYVHHPNEPREDVLLLGKETLTTFVQSIKGAIQDHEFTAEDCRETIKRLEGEKGTDTVDAEEVEEAEKARVGAHRSLEKAEEAMGALTALLDQVNNDWRRLDNRVLGHILRSPAIRLGVGEQRLTEDWAIFQVDRAKLGSKFQGNAMDLGTKLGPGEFASRFFTHGEDNWEFKYYRNGGLGHVLPLSGTITDELMRSPDMWDSEGEPCLLVLKNGNATGTTIGRANGAFSIVREYFQDMSVHQTSMQWAIINYNGKSEAFSEPGDSGAIIADTRGRIGGMLIGASGRLETPDITYATPFWWLLERIRANGFPNVHLDVVT